MMSYSEYDSVAHDYFALVAIFLGLLKSTKLTANINVRNDEVRIIAFTNNDNEKIYSVENDCYRDGTATKPWTTINGNGIGRNPIWGIDAFDDNIEYDEYLDDLNIIMNDIMPKILKLQNISKQLEISFFSDNSLYEFLFSNKQIDESLNEFITGAQSYANDIASVPNR